MAERGRRKPGRTTAAPGLAEAEILAQTRRARQRERRDREAGLRASSARYDPVRERIVLELTNGIGFAFPVEAVPGLSGASASKRAALELSPGGDAVVWPELDTDISVPGILEQTIGRPYRLRRRDRQSPGRAQAHAPKRS